MVNRLRYLLLLLLVLPGVCKLASADSIAVGILSFDETTPGSVDQFDITNLTTAGLSTITTGLTFTVTSLIVDLAGGGTVNLSGSDFTADAFGNLDCDDSACNLFGDNITGATLTGTLSPTTGLSGLPAGDTGIEAGYSTSITPGCGTTYLSAGCDAAEIDATGTGGVAAPEPGTWTLLGVGLVCMLFAGRKRMRNPRTHSLLAASVRLA